MRADLRGGRHADLGHPRQVARPTLAEFVAKTPGGAGGGFGAGGGDGGAGGGDGGAGGSILAEQSPQSRPRSHAPKVEGSPPSSQTPSNAQLQSLAQKAPAGNGGKLGGMRESRAPQSAQS